jgi:hypothetical protein
MINRDWFCLALRLFGIWLLIEAVETIVPYLLFAFSGSPIGQNTSWFVTIVLWLLARTAIGLVLLFFAPAIAVRIYPATAPTETTPTGDEARPLKVGIQLLGVYALLLAVQSVPGFILGLLAGERYAFTPGSTITGAGRGYLASLLTFGLNLAFAALLLMWNERVVTLIAKFRYVPERDAYTPPAVHE